MTFAGKLEKQASHQTHVCDREKALSEQSKTIEGSRAELLQKETKEYGRGSFICLCIWFGICLLGEAGYQQSNLGLLQANSAPDPVFFFTR